MGNPGWNFSGIFAVGSMPLFRLEATSWVVSGISGGSSLGHLKCDLWRKLRETLIAQMSPGGRPSIGPVSPLLPPTNAGLSDCWVVLAAAVGVGVNDDIGLRGTTSNRGIGVVNACTPKSGLGGIPVGMLLDVPPPEVPPPLPPSLAYATNGLRPPIGAMRPVPVIRPHLIRSRRETVPCE